ncbi:MAG: hypothetical protein WAM30_12635 [Candidatus Dormiibacterota bacterium]
MPHRYVQTLAEALRVLRSLPILDLDRWREERREADVIFGADDPFDPPDP